MGFEGSKRGLEEGVKIERAYNQVVTKRSILANFTPKLELMTFTRILIDILFKYFVLFVVEGRTTFFMFFHLIF